MTLQIDRTDIDHRLLGTKGYLSFIRSLESDSTPPVDSEDVKTLRGLFYVHLYGAFEKSVNECVSAFLSALSTLDIIVPEFEPRIWPIALDKYFRSLHSLPADSSWKKRRDFVTGYQAGDSCLLNDGLFSGQLQNAWPETIEEILANMGIPAPPFEHGDTLAIREIVAKRNEVAHGRSTPARVGASVRADNLQPRLESVERYIETLAVTLESEYLSLNYVQDQFRPKYQHAVQPPV